MGRSVSTPSNSIAVYDRFEGDYDEYEWFVEDLQNQFCALWPSVEVDDGWIGREDRILASNCHAYFGVSEYCGLVSIWVVPRLDSGWDADWSALAENWVSQIADRFQSEFGTMQRVGGMSNGQGVYVAREPENAPADDISGDSGHVVVNGMLCG